MNTDFGFEKNLDSLGYNKSRLVKLAGDASTRRYYRLFYNSGTRIIMEQEPFDPQKNPFNMCHASFSKLGIKIPHIYNIIPEKGIMILEDLGDVHLQNIESYSENYQKLFKEAVNILCVMQKNAKKLDPKIDYPVSYAFDFAKFYSELQMTTKYYIQGYRKKELTPELDKRINAFYTDLINQLLSQESMLQHRDYHSRNLIVTPDQNSLCVIDFQDARLGPYTYDLASLIIDPYANLDEATTQKLIRQYYDQIGVSESFDSFLRNYYLSFLQRGVKILGTYTYQNIVRHNDVYLQYIPVSIEKIYSVMHAFPEWKQIIDEVVS